MNIAQILFDYIDLAWIPVALICLHKGQRSGAVAFVLACAFILRLQIELMESIGYGEGIFHLIATPLYIRGLVTYALFTLGLFVLAYFSPRSDRFVFIAASITIFITAFCVSSAVMVL